MATEYFYGVDATGGVSSKPHGFVNPGYEALSSNFEFITIATAVDIRPNTTAGGGTATSQAALDKLIQVISLRGQPIIMGNVTGTASPFGLKLTIEHPYAWQSTATSASVPTAATLGLPWPDARASEDLVSRIKADGINNGFSTDATLTVTFGNVLA